MTSRRARVTPLCEHTFDGDDDRPHDRPTAAPPVAVGPCAVTRPLHQQPAAPVDSFAQAVHTLGSVDRQIAQVVVGLMGQMEDGTLIRRRAGSG